MSKRFSESNWECGCIFCNSITTEPRIMESEHFLVVRDIAPVVEPHMLVFPRFHTSSVADLASSHLDELELLVATLVRSEVGRQRRLFLYEHGRAPICTSNNGPSHAHVHVLALPCDLGARLNGKAGQVLDVAILPALHDLHCDTGEYMLWGPCGGPYRTASIRDKLPKRFLRTALSDIVGRLAVRAKVVSQS